MLGRGYGKRNASATRAAYGSELTLPGREAGGTGPYQRDTTVPRSRMLIELPWPAGTHRAHNKGQSRRRGRGARREADAKELFLTEQFRKLCLTLGSRSQNIRAQKALRKLVF